MTPRETAAHLIAAGWTPRYIADLRANVWTRADTPGREVDTTTAVQITATRERLAATKEARTTT